MPAQSELRSLATLTLETQRRSSSRMSKVLQGFHSYFFKVVTSATICQSESLHHAQLLAMVEHLSKVRKGVMDWNIWCSSQLTPMEPGFHSALVTKFSESSDFSNPVPWHISVPQMGHRCATEGTLIRKTIVGYAPPGSVMCLINCPDTCGVT